MRTTRILLCLTLLAGCGDGTNELGPKARRNERGDIERELRGESPEASPETAVEPPRGPIAAPSGEPSVGRRVDRGVHRTLERRTAPIARRELTASHAPTRPRVVSRPVAPSPATSPTTPRATVAAVVEHEEAPSTPELTRVVVAAEIASREPVVARLTADAERVFLFVEASHEGPGDATLRVVWIEPDGTRGRPIELDVPVSRRWRTWATTSRTHGRAGSWTVVVSDPSGEELARRSFEVAAPASDAPPAAPSATDANS